MVGIAIITFGITYQGSIILSILLTLIMLTISFISIRSYYKFGNICPVCKYGNMPSMNVPQGQEIIKNNRLTIEDTAIFMCDNCNYKGLGYRIQSLISSILIILLGLILLFYYIIMDQPLVLIGSFIIIGDGIYGISTNFNKNKCPSCKNNSLIPIDSGEAKLTMKDNIS